VPATGTIATNVLFGQAQVYLVEKFLADPAGVAEGSNSPSPLVRECPTGRCRHLSEDQPGVMSIIRSQPPGLPKKAAQVCIEFTKSPDGPSPGKTGPIDERL